MAKHSIKQTMGKGKGIKAPKAAAAGKGQFLTTPTNMSKMGHK